jgi:hypothetical protein
MFKEEFEKRIKQLPTHDPIFKYIGEGYNRPRFERVMAQYDLPKTDYLDRLIAKNYYECFDSANNIFIAQKESIERNIKITMNNAVLKFLKNYLEHIKRLRRPRSSALYKFFSDNHIFDIENLFQLAEFIDKHDLINNIHSSESKELGILLQRMRKTHGKSR